MPNSIKQPQPEADEEVDIPELDASADDEQFALEGLDELQEEIIGDTEGNDYRAGTIDPDGSDRGPYRALSTDLLEDVELQRRH